MTVIINYIEPIVHIIYDKYDEIKELEPIAEKYEGKINGRYGFNFPFNIIKSVNIKSKLINIITKYNDAQYIVVYKKGDVMTKKHELQHAKYYIDNEFRESVKKLWDSFDSKYKTKVISMLQKMGYPEHVMLDEFQAYYFTEKPNFFN
jgi:vacuolar-type H+-ATPase subunit E/Vma4